VAYDYVTETGIIVADTSTVLEEVQNEYKAAFGADLDVTPSTPQGLLISAEALSRDGIARLLADLANQFNPNLSGGVFLDAICAMTGLTRMAATYTTVTATVTGTAGTIITAGAQAATTAGDLFECTTATTIPAGGSTTAPFRAVQTGPIPCDAGTLTEIVDGILGWTSITNAAAGTLGADQQSDISLGRLRRNTLALQGTQTTEAISSAVYALTGVQSLTFRENTASTTQVIDGISMVAHSIYLCVYGGTDADIANAIVENRSAGTAFNGTTTVNVTVSSGQIIPVQFSRPTEIPVLIKLTVKFGATSGSAESEIKQRVLDYANGNLAGEPGFVVGGSVSPFEIAGAAMGVQGVYVQLVEVAPASTGIYQSTEIVIAIDQIATTTLASISVVIV